MRYYLCLVASLGLLIAPVASYAQTVTTSPSTQSAPADEYFGRASESILGIRNRLDAFDKKSDSDVLSRSTSVELNNLQDSILDWQQKYPSDPWLPTMMSRLVCDYARAGEASSSNAVATLRVMLDSYPNTPQTRDAVAAIGNEASANGNAVLQSVAADTDVPAVPSAPISDVTIASSQVDLVPIEPDSSIGGDLLNSPAWQAFDSSRSADSIAENAQDDMTVAGAVIDARTGAPVAGAVVFVAPDRDSSDVSATPFATTGNDGAFSVAHVPLGAAYSVGNVSLAHAEYVVVQPPRGSGYAAYHGMIDASNGNANAGVIRLTSQ
jgi:hypothetical protein